MNNRYLFRAKRIDNGEWVCGSYVYTFCEDKNGIVVGVKVEKHWIAEENGNMVWVDEDTICQCTGLKDKNGNLIWENDIVSLCDDIYKIVWDEDDARFALEDESVIESFNNIEGKWCEVAGNIFDNPELIHE